MCKGNLQINVSGIKFDNQLEKERHIREKTVNLAMEKINEIVAANTSGQSVAEVNYLNLAIARRLIQRTESHELMETFAELHPF